MKTSGADGIVVFCFFVSNRLCVMLGLGSCYLGRSSARFIYDSSKVSCRSQCCLSAPYSL